MEAFTDVGKFPVSHQHLQTGDPLPFCHDVGRDEVQLAVLVADDERKAAGLLRVQAINNTMKVNEEVHILSFLNSPRYCRYRRHVIARASADANANSIGLVIIKCGKTRFNGPSLYILDGDIP